MVFMDTLLATDCQPLLQRFLSPAEYKSLFPKTGSEANWEFARAVNFELYIPAPAVPAFLYHIATRNFFAWVFGKSLVGSHLGGALVGLLNSMNEFRSPGEDNVSLMLDYMNEEGYSDMRNCPDHALAVLFFAEHFHFKDLWTDAFAHCVGMNEKLIVSAGFEVSDAAVRSLL